MAVRLLALLASCLAIAGIALAAIELQRVWTQDAAAGPEARAAVRAAPAPPVPAGQGPRAWPALFGERVAPEPQPPTPPQPPAPPAPPLASLGYALRGMVAQGDGGITWALVSHPSGERIVRIGDMLAEGFEVVDIDAGGLWVESARGREVLEFAE